MAAVVAASCLSCAHWSVKRAGRMAGVGYGACNKRPAWEYQSPTYHCTKHSPVDAPALASRVAWMARRAL